MNQTSSEVNDTRYGEVLNIQRDEQYAEISAMRNTTNVDMIDIRDMKCSRLTMTRNVQAMINIGSERDTEHD